MDKRNRSQNIPRTMACRWESALLASWNYGELAEENDDDESDDSGDEFELQMCTDSSDNDVEELQNSLPSEYEDK
jgi:hypothetical protein